VLQGTRVALPVQPRGPAGTARSHLSLLSQPAARTGRRRGPAVRKREPDARAHRLLLVHARPYLFRKGSEHPREAVQGGPLDAATEGHVALVRYLSGADSPF